MVAGVGWRPTLPGWYCLPHGFQRNVFNSAIILPSQAFHGARRYRAYGAGRRDYSAVLQGSLTEAKSRLDFQVNQDSWFRLDNVSVYPVNVVVQDPTTRTVLFTNDTDAPVTIPLDHGWLDFDGHPSGDTLSLAPFTGAALVRGD